ncbi:MAG: VirB4 family type IV secretion system protein [Candidatus Nitrosotenuis sp.]
MTPFKYTYEIKPTNFVTLPDDKKLNALTKFYRLLASIQKSIRIITQKEYIQLEIGEGKKLLPLPRTFLVSTEPLEQILEQVGLEYSLVARAPTWKIKSEQLNYLILDDSFARCYSLYKVPSTLPAAWLNSILSYSEMVSVWIKPIEAHKAVAQMQRYLSLVSAGANTSHDLRYRTEKGLAVLDGLAKQQTKLFLVSATSMIKSDTLDALKIQDKNFKAAMRTMMVSFDSASAIQKQMLLDGLGKALYFDLASCAAFYPFVSSDMIEAPNGVILGVNLGTGAPIIYDYTQRENYNILLLASSGAGKSVTAKTLLKRLAERFPDAKIFVIDPNGEYEKVGSLLGLDVLKVTQEQNLGLDPFRLFDATDAADILADIKNTNEIIRTEFRAQAADCKSVKEFYTRVNQKAKEYLSDLVHGRLSAVLEGDPKISDKLVISLRGTDGQDRIFLLLLLALGKVWKKINTIEPQIPKIILIDEGWMLFMKNASGRFLNTIARVGRKFNVVFMFVTQRPEDVIENEYGRAIADNAATKIFLQNTEQAADKIKSAMSLSDEECELIKTLSRGQCLLLTKDYRLYAQIVPSGEELKVFSTTPV